RRTAQARPPGANCPSTRRPTQQIPRRTAGAVGVAERRDFEGSAGAFRGCHRQRGLGLSLKGIRDGCPAQSSRNCAAASSAVEPEADGWVYVATLEELKSKGMTVARGGSCPLLVIHDQGSIYALDNRCPHLGFPLHRGSVEDGILTCHWHHARFDLASGGTFDLWADDVPTAAVELRDDGAVWVSRRTRYADGDDHWRNRLREGLQHNIGLVLAKAVLGLRG